MQHHFRNDIRFGTNLIIAFLIFALAGSALLRYGVQSPFLHTIFDTSVVLTGALIALLLWDIGNRTDRTLPFLLAIVFTLLAVGELLHTLAALEWLGGTGFGVSDVQWRAGTWGPTAHILPIGVGLALFLRNASKRVAVPYAAGLLAFMIILFFVFQAVPRYSDPGFLGITRPSLIVVPLLWVVVGYGYWRVRHESEIKYAIAFTAVLMFVAHSVQLYSRAPSDPIAMVAHLGKFLGDALLLISLTQIGAADTVRRQHAEHALRVLNDELERRVAERTAALTEEIVRREAADRKLGEQLQRLDFLNRITRLVAERLDLRSIFQVVVRSLEEQLPADFVSVSTYDITTRTLKVEHVGSHSGPLALQLAMPERAKIEIDQNGLARCVAGQLVYEPDVVNSPFPFPNRLAQAGLRSLAIIPLAIERSVFAVLIVARYTPASFNSTDCEFLRQLGEHAGLAAHQAQLYASLQAAYEDLQRTRELAMHQERLRALGQMASGIAHDINNAISPVALYTASLLESGAELPDRVRSYLETVKRVTNDIAATVARLREFYRRREAQAESMHIKINDVVRQVVDLTRARWSDMPQRRGIVVDVKQDLAATDPVVSGVDNELREMLTNLVFNAVDALPRGGTITIRTCVVDHKDEPWIRLEVIDNGVGMDEETRRRCMDPFFTTKGDRGTGLGLGMVQAIAKRHGAGLGFDTALGRGTTVWLEFPAATQLTTLPVASAAKEKSGPLCLLIVDDDPFILDSMRAVLELDNHIVVEADGGQRGIDTFRAAVEEGKHFDIVITDLGMPGVDGNRVATAIKCLSPSTPVILLTGWGQPLRSTEEHPANIDLLLPKPPELDDLRSAFKELMTKRR